jgi:uncharacterized protein (DUF4415 family)
MSKRPPPDDFDENPVWTEEMHARAKPASEVHGPEIAAAMVRKRGRPAGSVSPDSKRQVSLRIDPDVLAAYKAAGPGWQTRMNEALRKGLDRKRA